MALTLAIDTAVGVSVAVCDGATTLAQQSTDHHGVQGELTAVMIRDAFATCGRQASDIERIVVGVGPGPFTGLRVGMATAVAMGVALGVPVIGVCSLDAVAYDSGAVRGVAVSDARRKELYFATWADGVAGEPGVAYPADLAERFAGELVFGPAAGLYPDHLAGNTVPLRAAALVAALDTGMGRPRPITPLYLRKPDAIEPAARKQVGT